MERRIRVYENGLQVCERSFYAEDHELADMAARVARKVARTLVSGGEIYYCVYTCRLDLEISSLV